MLIKNQQKKAEMVEIEENSPLNIEKAYFN